MVIKNGAKMSKSLGNVVSPDDMVARYGADATRLYTLFAARPTAISTGRTRAWKASIVSSRASTASSPRTCARPGESREPEPHLAPARKVLRKLHQTIQRITDDFQGRWHFNTSVAAMMELLNACMEERSGGRRDPPRQGLPPAADVQRKLVLLLNPFAPYLAAELWAALGEDANALLRHPWPQADPVLAKEDEVEIVVQFNGKVRAASSWPDDARRRVRPPGRARR